MIERAKRAAGAERRRNPLASQLYRQLAAGGFQSGAVLARELGVSRNAIWKAVRALRGLGLTIHAVPHRGYRLPVLCEPLEAAAIRAALSAHVRRRIRRLEALWSVASTNAVLLGRNDLPPDLADILVAEYQTAGRGRLGRSWIAPPGGSICLSIGWSFPELPPDLAALGLAVGVCALRALRRHVADGALAEAHSRRAMSHPGLALKWPNDLILGDRKLGGILIEMRAESAGPTYVVIGIGINLVLGSKLLEQVAAMGTRAAELSCAGADPRRRNALAADLASEIVDGLARFRHEGLLPFIEEWRAADSLCGRAVTVRTAQSSWSGIARGIDASGALLIETEQGMRKLLSGDVSVRAGQESMPAPRSPTGSSSNVSFG
jgi:BirA family transcriptional regulator, biotin operon repressor / biotin---[acetyl-CoA-carboxylase] ligase